MKHPSHALFPVAFVALALASGSAAPVQDPVQAAAQIEPLVPGAVPVGTVLMWWGLESDLPAGFETCDGKFPLTKEATLKERKPDLRDRFMKGAKDFSNFRPQTALSGGTNGRGDVATDRHLITPDELPKHRHPIDHTHTIAPHAHSLETHVHSIGQFVSILFAAGSESGTFLSQNTSRPTDVTGPSPTGTTTGRSELTTQGPSPAVSGENAWKGGTQLPHSHMVHIGDTLPAFLEMIYIIRVK